MINYNKQDILEAFLKDTTIIDNHDKSLEEISYIVEFNSNSRELAAVIKTNSRYQSLNTVYLDNDNKLHLSQQSVGGVLYNEQDNILKYNESVAFEGLKIKNVYYPDGTFFNII